jgi:parallel beta-helix repeat protein
VDAAAPGTLVLVSNGVYQAGARAVYGMNNRLAVTKPLTVRSVNGPGVTSIVGGAGSVRCVYLTNGTFFSGFTLTNGATQTSGDIDRQQSGGGVWCESVYVVVSNCVLVGNSAHEYGGGIYSGTVTNCTLLGNSAWEGGGSYRSTLNNCTLSGNQGGGGAWNCTLTNCILRGNSDGGAIGSLLDHCTLSSNSSHSFGGGSCGGVLNRFVLEGNSAFGGAGGAYQGTLNNCVLVGNSAMTIGGAKYGTLNNCIVYYNSGGNYYQEGVLNYCCTTPLPQNGTGNFTNAPLLVDLAGGDLRLQTNSPCINAGLNAYAPGTLDLDGNPRISGGTVDVGAYEFPSPTSRISYAWLQGYGFPTDGSADYLDPDLDGMNNWQEWVAGTDSTNAASVLRLTGPVFNPPTLVLRWNSYAGYVYFVQRATNLAVPRSFTTLASNIPGLPYATTYTDTNTFVSNTAAFYRVGASSSVPSPILLQKPLLIPVSVTLTWSSFTNRTYSVERATNLLPPAAFSLLQSNLPGLSEATSFTDTNPPPSVPAFYRVGVQP